MPEYEVRAQKIETKSLILNKKDQVTLTNKQIEGSPALRNAVRNRGLVCIDMNGVTSEEVLTEKVKSGKAISQAPQAGKEGDSGVGA